MTNKTWNFGKVDFSSPVFWVGRRDEGMDGTISLIDYRLKSSREVLMVK